MEKIFKASSHVYSELDDLHPKVTNSSFDIKVTSVISGNPIITNFFLYSFTYPSTILPIYEL